MLGRIGHSRLRKVYRQSSLHRCTSVHRPVPVTRATPTPHLGQGQRFSGWSLQSLLCASSPDLERTPRSDKEAVCTESALAVVGIGSACTDHLAVVAHIVSAVRRTVFGITAVGPADTDSVVDDDSSVAVPIAHSDTVVVD